MGVHRYENLIFKKIFCMVLLVVVHRKKYNRKFIHMKNHFNEQVVFRIGFLQFLFIRKQQVGIKIFIHVHFK